MDNIVTYFNENTSLIKRGDSFFIKKRLSADDAPLFQKLLKISSPCLARVFEICFDEKYLYAIMEYVPGKTLAQTFEEAESTDLKDVIKIAVNVCEGLSVLHKNGIVHRDVNPNNIIIAPDGRAVIIDFGISRTEKEEKKSDTTILGTAGWTAPEQFGFRQTNAQSDIYSVGVLLNYLQNGKMPNEEIPENDLAPIIRRCTLIKPEERFESADELETALILTFNKLSPKDKIVRKSPLLKRIFFGLYYFLASVFLLVFVSLADEPFSGEGVCMFFLGFFALFLPPFFVNLFNSRQRLFYYKSLKSKRLILTISSVVLCLIIAFIIFIFITQKWAVS